MTTRPRRKLDRKLPDDASFLRRFLNDPRRTGAVAPSGRFLAREMARAVDPEREGDVIELGPGTGSVTKALLARGLPRERLWLVEYSPGFCESLRERFGLGDRVVRGDAYDIAATLAGRAPRVLAVVSSLPLLNEPPARRIKLLDEAFELMGPDGIFVQFTYGLRAPVSREACGGRYVAHCGAPILLNLPPAGVWVYRRAEAEPSDAMGRRGGEARNRIALIARQGKRVREMIRREGLLARNCGKPALRERP